MVNDPQTNLCSVLAVTYDQNPRGYLSSDLFVGCDSCKYSSTGRSLFHLWRFSTCVFRVIRGMKSRANVNSKLGVLGWLQVTISPTNKASEDYVPSVKIPRTTSRWYSSKHSADIFPQRNFNCGGHHLFYWRGMCRHVLRIGCMCKCLNSTCIGINLRSPMLGWFEIYSPGLVGSLGLRVTTRYVIGPDPGP